MSLLYTDACASAEIKTERVNEVGEKSLSFPGFSRAINVLFRRLSQQKLNVIMTYIKGHFTSTIVPIVF